MNGSRRPGRDPRFTPHENLAEPSRNLRRPCPGPAPPCPSSNLRRLCPEPSELSRKLRRDCQQLPRPFPEPELARNVRAFCPEPAGAFPEPGRNLRRPFPNLPEPSRNLPEPFGTWSLHRQRHRPFWLAVGENQEKTYISHLTLEPRLCETFELDPSVIDGAGPRCGGRKAKTCKDYISLLFAGIWGKDGEEIGHIVT